MNTFKANRPFTQMFGFQLFALLGVASYAAAVPNQSGGNSCVSQPLSCHNVGWELTSILTQCSKLEKQLPGKVVYSGDDVYESEQGSYYSLVQADLKPACRVEPTSTDDVVAIVKLAAQEQCQFALRSGGHMTFKGVYPTMAVI